MPRSKTAWRLCAPLLLVGVATLVRLAPLVLPFDFSGPDSASYVDPAASLAAGRGYSGPGGEPSADRPPGYPVFLALCFLLEGSASPLLPRLAQALLGGLSCLLLVWSLRPRSASLAWLAGWLHALDPIAIGQAPFLLREALLTFLIALLVWVSTQLRGRRRWLGVAGVLSALTLTHQLYLLLGGFLCLADLAASRRSARGRVLASWLAVGLLVFLAIFLWARRNQRIVGHLSLTASANAVPARELWLTSECSNLWLSGDFSTGFQARAFAEERRLVDELGLAAAKSELYRRTWENWRTHPSRSLARLARINFWYWVEVPGAVRLAGHERLHVVRWVLLPLHWALLGAAALGLRRLRSRGDWRGSRACLATLGFFALAPALLYPVPRYLGPASPLLAVFAALGLEPLLAGWLPGSEEPAT